MTRFMRGVENTRFVPLLLAAAGTLCAGGAFAEPVKNPQYVLISFDGAGPQAQWQRSLELGKKTGARFTYFLSCSNVIAQGDAARYQSPEGRSGKSNIGFAKSRDEVRGRLTAIWAAASQGHEIGNHTCGHFDGKGWTKEQWLSEFRAFDAIMSNAYKDNGFGYEPQGWRQFVKKAIKGFRAPYLSTNKAMNEALATRGLRYDASGVEREISSPKGNAQLARFSLPQIQEGPSGRRIIAMDYNLFVRHSGGFERASESEAFEARAYQAFRSAFDTQYQGKRRPLQIGMHFTLMNGGAYWRAMERLAGDVCGKPDVRCVTYSKYLDENPLTPDKMAKLEPHKGGS
jgi:peptidoglycan/xylan/chitin deacetylase (PgdA/CDA1 family)